MRRPLPLLALAVGVALLAGCAPVEPVLTVTAFQPAYADPDLIDESAENVDIVGIQGVAITPEGDGVEHPSEEVLAHLDRTRELGLQSELLLTNYVAGVGFSRELAALMLSSARNREGVVDGLARLVEKQDWDGIMLDLESLGAEEAAGLSRFARELRAAVGPDIQLTIAIMATDTADGYTARGYDLPELVKHLDRITVMAYDLHGPWNPEDPGPVGDLDWQRACLDALLELIDADQIDLGVAGYGYRWLGPEGSRAVSDRQARRFVDEDGATARWDAQVGEWTATLSDGTVMWWSDARSLAERVELALELELHGVAVWSLAVSDPIGPLDLSTPRD